MLYKLALEPGTLQDTRAGEGARKTAALVGMPHPPNPSSETGFRDQRGSRRMLYPHGGREPSQIPGGGDGCDIGTVAGLQMVAGGS
jgi:hypothetical protein